MSASGKSSNRHYEYHRGYHGGGGHGIYASAGAADRRAEQERAVRAAEKKVDRLAISQVAKATVGVAFAAAATMIGRKVFGR